MTEHCLQAPSDKPGPAAKPIQHLRTPEPYTMGLEVKHTKLFAQETDQEHARAGVPAPAFT